MNEYIDLLGAPINPDDLQRHYEWLNSEYGKFFWDWVRRQSSDAHNRASEPAREVMGLVASQRNLAAENAFDQVLNYASVVKEVGKEQKALNPI